MISVIVPLYNVEHYVLECLKSISSQTYTDLEVLLIEDCSTDNTLDIVRSFLSNYSGDIIFRLICHEKNRGLSSARNTGLELARGDYIGFVDSDDFISPIMYETLLGLFHNDANNIGIVGCNYFMVDENSLPQLSFKPKVSGVIEPEDFAYAILTNSFSMEVYNKLYKREVLEQVRFVDGKLNEVFLFALDLYPVIEKKHYLTISIDDCLYFYRHRPLSICTSTEHCLFIDILANLEEAEQRLGQDRWKIKEELKHEYLRRLVSLIAVLSNPHHCEHHLYDKYCKKLVAFEDEFAKKALQEDDYNTFIYMKYFPGSYQLSFGEKITVL